MITYHKFELENGLKVIVHTDKSTPLVAMNTLYDVGARDENEAQTGFAHLFEHLMFGGSINIENYDKPLQKVGGTNNAFTSNDITNYYLVVPKENIETGFWLESDRMLSLAFSEKSLEVQRNVVIEEFKQNYLNQPYGDVYMLLRPMVYKKHPYKWATIGKAIAPIENATMPDVRAFFKTHYLPSNAILCLSGNIELDEVKSLCEKWYASIPVGEKTIRDLPIEPKQTEKRELSVERDVPVNAIYFAFNMCSGKSDDYYVYDLISDILSTGKSSRFYRKLIIEQAIFSDLDAYVSGSLDPGMFIISGKLNENISMEIAETKVMEELQFLKNELIDNQELQKVKNKVESIRVFSEMSILNKAMNLCSFELLEDIDLINTLPEKYTQITAEKIQEIAANCFREENVSVLKYYKKK